MEYKPYTYSRLVRHLASFPFIWFMVIPLVFLDICLEMYHRICFPLYGIAYVEREHYIRSNRQKLKYLTWYEKINCLYCGYANGLLHYASRIAADTEKYWCGIKEEKYPGFNEPEHRDAFVEYGNEEEFRTRYT